MNQCGIEFKHNGAIFYCVADEGHPGLCTYIGLDTIPAPEVAALAREIRVVSLALMSWVTPDDNENARHALRKLHCDIDALLKLAEPENSNDCT